MHSVPTARTFEIRHATYPLSRCAGCDRRLSRVDAAVDGKFPISSRDCLLLVHCRVCADCLDGPDPQDERAVRCLAVCILRHLSRWYAALSSLPEGRTAVAAHPAPIHRARAAQPEEHPTDPAGVS